jgi:hypothetical protein
MSAFESRPVDGPIPLPRSLRDKRAVGPAEDERRYLKNRGRFPTVWAEGRIWCRKTLVRERGRRVRRARAAHLMHGPMAMWR